MKRPRRSERGEWDIIIDRLFGGLLSGTIIGLLIGIIVVLKQIAEKMP